MAFRALVASTPPPSASDASDGFVKQANATRIQIMSAASRLKALALSERGLIGKFIRIWPSPKTMDFWVKKLDAFDLRGPAALLLRQGILHLFVRKQGR